MRKISSVLRIIFCLCIFAGALNAADYKISKTSKVSFKITKFMIFSVEGSFKELDGSLSLNENNQISALNIQIKSASVSTGKEKRDKFARDELLDATNHPYIYFKMISYKPKVLKSGTITGKMVGKVTLHGTSKNIEFDSTLINRVLSLKGVINNKDFGLKGKASTSDDVKINLHIDVDRVGLN